MQNIKDINVTEAGKVTLKEVIQKLLNINPSDKQGCPKGALVVKKFGGYRLIKMHMCALKNPPCNYFKRTHETPTPIYIGVEEKKYTYCPNH